MLFFSLFLQNLSFYVSPFNSSIKRDPQLYYKIIKLIFHVSNDIINFTKKSKDLYSILYFINLYIKGVFKLKAINRQINWSKILSFVGLMWIASGHFYPLKISIGESIVPINSFSEFYLIPVFAVWRLKTEKDAFQKRRVKGMMALFLIYWIVMPILIRGDVPLVDGSITKLIPSYHAIGSVGFFLFFIAVLLFGKRADCGWNCTCVFTRETLAFPFRDQTKKGEFWWRLRHLKWIMLIIVWTFFLFMVIDPKGVIPYRKPMYKLILDLYYFTVLLIPFTGHRNICRFTCPWSATWALLNKIGPYKIVADVDRCISCGICDRECDMGVPIQKLIKKTGMIDTGECMGCERCIRKCPKEVLKVEDFRDRLPGFNLSSVQRGVRVILGLTLIILPFIYNGPLYTIIGAFSIASFLSGLFGYCPIISLKKSKQLSSIDTK